MDLSTNIQHYTSSNSDIHGLGEWLGVLAKDSTNWTVTAFTTSPEPRVSVTWSNRTFQQIIDDWATSFAACAEVNASAKTVNFELAGSCN